MAAAQGSSPPRWRPGLHRPPNFLASARSITSLSRSSSASFFRRAHRGQPCIPGGNSGISRLRRLAGGSSSPGNSRSPRLKDKGGAFAGTCWPPGLTPPRHAEREGTPPRCVGRWLLELISRSQRPPSERGVLLRIPAKEQPGIVRQRLLRQTQRKRQ